MARASAADPYVYPGTTVLRNRLDIRDAGLLAIAEYAATARRTDDAPTFPVSAAGYQATHRHLFQDVYGWAGELRSVGLRNPREAAEFARPNLIAGALSKQFDQFGREGPIAGVDADVFARRAGEHIGELNAIHPFRDGNGRTMRLHLAQLAEAAGHWLDLSRIPGPAWNDASRVSFNTARSDGLIDLIRGALVSSRDRPPSAAADLSADGKLVYAALADKIDRQMVRLGPEERESMRRQIARELQRKEAAEGPVVLSAEQKRMLIRDAPSPSVAKPGREIPKR